MSEPELPGTDWRNIEDEGFIGLVGPIWAAPLVDRVATFRFRAEHKHNNLRGVVQGGMLMTFADRAMGMTARQDEIDRPQATVQLDVHFMEAVRIGETVEITCRILRTMKSLIFVDGIMTVEDRTVATARGTWKILKPLPAV